jgi:hypothetical protein
MTARLLRNLLASVLFLGALFAIDRQGLTINPTCAPGYNGCPRPACTVAYTCTKFCCCTTLCTLCVCYEVPSGKPCYAVNPPGKTCQFSVK